jgi:hypothetical protein
VYNSTVLNKWHFFFLKPLRFDLLLFISLQVSRGTSFWECYNFNHFLFSVHTPFIYLFFIIFFFAAATTIFYFLGLMEKRQIFDINV